MTELTQLEQFLRQPDAVMEPNIMEKLRQYVAKGGSPRDVVEMLTDSYIGEKFKSSKSILHIELYIHTCH